MTDSPAAILYSEDGYSVGVLSSSPVGTERGLVVRQAGSVTIVQATGTNLHSVLDSGTLTNLQQLAGAPISMNTGVRDAGTQRVTIATNDVVPSSQSGTWNITNVSGTVSLPTGASTETTLAKLPVAQGTSLGANSQVLQGGSVTTAAPAYTTGQISPLSLTTAGSLRTDSSATTQPVSGTVTANAGTGNFTVVQAAAANLNATVTGTVAATQSGTWNIGNVTGTVALPTGASTEATLAKLTVAQSTALGSNTQALVGGSVTTAAPTYTTGQINPLSLTTAGALRVDIGAASVSENLAQVGGNAVNTGNGAAGTGTQRVVLASDQTPFTVNAAQSGTWNINNVSGTVSLPTGAATESSLAKLTVSQGAALGTNTQTLQGGSVTTAAPTYTAGQISPLSITTAGALRTDSSGTTQPVSGTVTANAGTGNFTIVQSTAASLNATVIQGTAANLRSQTASEASTASAIGTVASLSGGSVTTAAPTYTTGQLNSLSLTTAGSLRIDGSGSTQPISGTITANIGTSGSLALDATLTGGTQCTKLTDGTNNAAVKAASTAAVATDPAVVVAISPNNTVAVTGTFFQATQPVSGTVAATQSGTWNLTNITGTISLPTGAATDATLAKLTVSQGTALGANTQVLQGGSVTTTAPTYTTGQISPLSLTTAGALRVDIGAASLSENLAQVNGATVNIGNGTAGTGTQRVVLASDQTPFTVNAAQSGSWTSTVTQATGTNLHTVVDSGTITSNIGTTGGIALDATLAKLTIAQGASTGANTQALAGSVTTAAAPTYTTATINPLSTTTSGALRVDGSATTQPVSGTVTANAGTGNFTVVQSTAANLNATVTGTVASTQSGTWTNTVTQATGTNLHTVIDSGTVTANVGTTGGLALDATITGGTQTTRITDGTNTASVKAASTASVATDKALVVAISPNNSVAVTGTFFQTTQPVSGTVAATQSGAWNITNISGTVSLPTGAATESSLTKLTVAQGSSLGTNTQTMVGGSVTTAAPAYTTGQVSPLSLTTTGSLRTDSSATTQPVSGTVTANAGTGSFTVVQTTGTNLHTVIDSGTITTVSTVTNLSQLGGAAVSMNTGVRDAGTQRVTIATNDVVPTSQSGTWTNTVTQATAASLNATIVGLGTAGTPSGGVVSIQGVAGGTAIPVSGTVTAANASVSATAATPPGSATYVGGSVTTAAPTYTTGQLNAFSLTTAGGLRVDGSGSTQPVSGTGTFTVVQATGANLNATVSGTVAATQSGTWNLANITGTVSLPTGASTEATLAKLTVSQGAALGTNTQTLQGGSVTTAAPTYTTGQISPLSLTTAGALRTDSSASTQPVSGTVTANIGTSGSLALDATLTGGTQRTKITDGTTNASVKAASTAAIATDTALVVAISPNNTVAVTGTVTATNASVSATGSAPPASATFAGASVTTAAPAYTTGQMSALSLTTAGGLRVDGSGTTQPVNGTVTANAGTGNFTVVQTTAANLNATVTGTVAATQSGTWTNTVTQATGTNLHTVVDSGTITSNIGTTGGLALDATLTGGTQRTKLTDGTTNASVKAASTAAAATDTALVVAVSPNNSVAVTGTFFQATQPVSGTVAATQSGTWTNTVTQATAASLNATIVGLGTAGTPSGGVVSIQGVSGGQAIPVSGTVTATNASVSATGAAPPASATFAGASVTTAAPTYTTGQMSALSLTTAGGLRIDGSATTQPVSGTVAATQSGTWNLTNITGTVSLPTGASTDATVAKLTVAQGAALGTNTQTLQGGSVTTASPTYTTGQISPLSLTTAGALRIDGSASTQPVSGTVSITANSSVNLSQVAGTTTSVNNGTSTAGTQRVVIASDQTAFSVNAVQSGTWTVQPGNTANTTPWLSSISQGGSTASVKAAATAPVTADSALVVALSPNISPDINVSGSLGALNATVVLPLYGKVSAAAQFTGTWVGTITTQCSVDGGVTWSTIRAYGKAAVAIGSTFTANNVITFTDLGGCTHVRLNMTAYTSGTAVIVMNAAMTYTDNFYQYTGVDADTSPPTRAFGIAFQDAGGIFRFPRATNTTPTGTEYAIITRPVPGAAQTVTGTVAATQSGTWTNTVTQATAANLNATVVGLGTAGTPSGGVVTIQGAAGGTAIPVSGTVTAANASVSATGTTVPASATFAGGSVTTAAPTYTTGQMSALSLTTTGALRTDGSATTQPVSGTVAATQSGTWTVQPGNTANTTPWLASVSQGGNTATVVTANPASTAAGLTVRTSGDGLVSTANSTSANLGAGAVFTGTAEDISQYQTIKIQVFSSHVSATDGLSMQSSTDGTNWDRIDTYSIPAATGKEFMADVGAQFFRLVYTNGATLTTSLRIQTIYHKAAARGSSVRPQDARTNDNDMSEVISYLSGFNGTTWDRLRSATTTPAGTEQALITRNIPSGTQQVSGTITALTTDTSGNGIYEIVTTSALTNVASLATTQQLLAANTNRRSLVLYNDSTSAAFVKFGTTASAASFTYRMAPGATLELQPPAIYSGRIDVIWATANGNMRVTELTP